MREPQAQPLLELRGLAVNYGPIAALNGIDLEVRTGEIVGLVGANGAGKTTTLRAISGLVSPRAGEIRFEDRVLRRHTPGAAVRAGIAHCPEGRRVFPTLSVRENIELGAAVLPNAQRAAALDEMLDLFPVLRERAGQQGATLSGGEQQMLAIARALASRPRLLMLDEPSLGLAPLIVAQVADLIRQVRERGTTVLLVEQNAALTLALSNRAYVLENGSIALSGVASEMAQDVRVRDAYLGSGTFKRRRDQRPVAES